MLVWSVKGQENSVQCLYCKQICSLCANTEFYFEIGLTNSDIQAQHPEPDTPGQSHILCPLRAFLESQLSPLTSSTGDSAKQTGTH